MNLRTFAISCFLLLTFYLKAQTINLDYAPKGKIIKFYFDSLNIYTDTTSFFYIYAHEERRGYKAYDRRIKNVVLQQFKISKNDTATFSGDLIPFNDSINNAYEKGWYVDWAILNFTREDKLKIYDKHGQLVKTIITKKIGTKRNGRVRRAYINKDTKEELFSSLWFFRTYMSSF